MAHPDLPGIKDHGATASHPWRGTLDRQGCGLDLKVSPMVNYVALIDEVDGMYGAQFPDCPGCTAMASTQEELYANAVEALGEWMADHDTARIACPRPRAPLDIQGDPSVVTADAPAPAMLVVPLLLDGGRVVRANISVDAGLLEAIDDAAKARGLTRSGFLASAAREKIAAQR